MKQNIRKSINIWSFPQEMRIADCMALAAKAGFEGIELALSADGELNPDTGDAVLAGIRSAARQTGIGISGLATGLFWQYSLTSDREDIRDRAVQVIRSEIEIARKLELDTVLVCPGAVGVDFRPEEVVPDAKNPEHYTGDEIIDYEIAYMRAQESLRFLAADAEKCGVVLAVENIWNKFLLSPLEFCRFLDEIHSPYVQAYFDVGNVMLFGYPEQWIRILDSRIRRVHFKDFRRGTAQLSGFVDLLSGDVAWDRVMQVLRRIRYSGWINGEMCPPYRHCPEQNIFTASQAMDRILNLGKEETDDGSY